MFRHTAAFAFIALLSGLWPARALANDFVPDSGFPRRDGVGTVLPDGTVLIATGNDQTSQRYDPFLNQWFASATLTSGHSGAAFVRLRDGGAVLADNDPYMEFYDLDAQVWVLKPNWGIPRQVGTAVESLSGDALFVGGKTTNGAPDIPEIEQLGPDGGWGSVGLLPTPVAFAASLVLSNDDLLVVGGQTTATLRSTTVQRLTHVDGGYVPRAAGQLAVGRYENVAVALADGRVLAAGGVNYNPAPARAELYDPVTDAWSDAGATSAGRGRTTATLLPNGRVYVAGGQGGWGTADIFNPLDGSWTTVPLATGRASHIAAILPTGELFLTGGVNAVGTAVDSSEVYDPSVPAVASAPSLNAARSGAALAVDVVNGRALALGGAQGGAPLASSEWLAAGAASWSAGPSMATGRAAPAVATLADGRILVTGGGAATEVFDPADGFFHPAEPMADGRDRHALVRLASGRVLAVGGVADGGQWLVSAEVYDPGQDRWTRAGDLPRAGAELTGTLLPSGQVLVAGGSVSGGAPSAETFLFDEGSLLFSPLPPMGTARRGHTATLLNNGNVLVAGGLGASGPLSSAEWFDPTAGAWAPVSPMLAARAGHSAALLQNGKVLMAGGDAVGTTELFDIIPKAFRGGPPLGVALAGARAAVLADHRVLLAGGSASGSDSAAALLFDEGRGADPAWTPRLDPPAVAMAGAAVALSGALFTGVSSGSGGSWTQAPANLPLFTARLPSGADQRFRTLVWETTRSSARVPVGLPMGPYALTVTVNGVPSASETLWLGGAVGSACSVPGQCLSRTCDAGACQQPPQQPAVTSSFFPCTPECRVACDCASPGGPLAWVAVAAVLAPANRRRTRVAFDD